MKSKKIISAIVAALLALGYWVLENVDFGKFNGLKDLVGKGGAEVQGETSQVGNYERLSGCTLIDHRNNDGDSFHVRHDGTDYEFRLYFVDTPESKYKTYGGGENNGKRIRQQGEYFGGLDQKQTTDLGTEGKKFTINSLKARPFTVYTKKQSVFNSGRFFCMVKVEDASGKERWLAELLVEQGLVRVYTEGANMPDGTPMSKQKKRLLDMERTAKKGKLGGWRFGR